MGQDQNQLLLQFFKALSDKNRLKIVGLLSNREYSVGELAERLDLKAPTVSHHLSKLRKLGLLNLRADGNNRFYRLNTEMLERMNQHIFHLEAMYHEEAGPERMDAWIDELDIDIDDRERKVLKDYTVDGRLKQIPTKAKKLRAVLRWLATKFEPGVQYTEREVNDILTQYHADYARLRRELVNFRFLAREGGGGAYWVPTGGPEE